MEQQTIKCAFCKGIGKNPHFGGTCPVCKGKGENQVTGKYMACGGCRGSGQKRGTSLTCYTCGGLGMVPDTRGIIGRARKEIREAREEMEKEREEFREKPEAKGDGQKLIDKLKAENNRLRKRFSDLPTEGAKAKRNTGSGKRRAMKSAIASFCEDCAFGVSRECWDIECALAAVSPVAKTIGG